MRDVIEEMRRLSSLVDNGVDALRDQSSKVAEAERAYRQSKAQTWTTVRAEGDRTAAHMQAEVDARTADLRFARDVAEGMRDAARQALMARRQQMSMLQSVLAADRAEAEYVRTSPREVAS